MDTKPFVRGALSAAALFAAVAVAPVQAATVTFNLDTEFSGAQSPQGATPWITAVIDDSIGGPNTVRLTMTAANLVDQEAVTEWFFNFSGDATQLTFAQVNTAAATVNSILTDNNTNLPALKADGDGFFDFGFNFAPPPGTFADRFTTGETMVYDLTYTGAISASDFSVFSAPGGGNGSFLSAAHVQAITDTSYCDGSTSELTGACGSGWIGTNVVPVPAALWLFGSGLVGLVSVARRRS